MIWGTNSKGSKYKNCGSNPKFSNEQRQTIIDIALSKPGDLGLPFTEWSLPKLNEYVIEKTDIDYISHETIRRILQESGIKYRRTKPGKNLTTRTLNYKNKIVTIKYPLVFKWPNEN